MEINPRIYAFLCLFLLVFGFIFGLPYIFPVAKPINSMSKPVFENETNLTIVTVYKTVMVTPTPDGHIYFASEYQNGTRLLQRPFSFIRYQALFNMDMKVTTIVYDYRLFQKLHWFNPALYKYQEQIPENDNNQFLFIFVYSFMDDIQGDDTRFWQMNRNMFAVDINGVVYRNLEYPYQLRYREMESTPNFNGESYIQAYKQERQYTRTLDAVKTAGEISDEKFYLRGGKSNAIDGYLIFEIPKDTKPEDIKVLANFYSFGSAQWVLRA
jgi:hypothetical protein